MNEDCSKQSCDVPKNAVQDYLQSYSLNQVVVTNSEFIAVINGVTITIPAGTFSYPITGSTSTFPSISFQGCQSLISMNIPAGSSFAQIQALVQSMLNQVAQQQAQCNAASASGSSSIKLFSNQQVAYTFQCSVLFIAAQLPNYISQSGSTLVMIPGVFSSSISQNDADSKAATYLNNYAQSLTNNGTAMCGCVDENIVAYLKVPVTIPVDGSTITLTVDDTSKLVTNPAQDQQGGKWYWVGGLAFSVVGIWISIDSITDSTSFVATVFLGGTAAAGLVLPSGVRVVNATNPQIADTTPMGATASITPIDSLALNVKDCNGSCSQSSANPWDGTLNFRDAHSLTGNYTLIRYELFGGGVATLNGIVLDTGAHNGVDINYGLVTSPPDFWRMFIRCGPSHDVLWIGIKYSGNTPAGIYYSVNATCVLKPPCVTVV